MKLARALDARLLVVTAVAVVAACGSSSGTHSSAEAPAGSGPDAAAPPPTTGGDDGGATDAGSPPPPPPPPYDTSVGVGVDANGFANLPLRSGGHRYFVSSATGNDSNGCTAAQQPGTPMKTIAAGIACVQAGNGDQVLVAEGTTYSEGIPNFDAHGGNSPEFPTVLETYDPADASNAGKYGRSSNGRRPVVNTGGNSQPVTCCSNTPASYFAIRGFDINPGNVPDQGLSIIGSNNLPNSYVLIENNLFRYTSLAFNQPLAAGNKNQAVHHVIRKNSFYGQWSPTAHAQGLFNAGVDGFTAEDNVFWHVGWKVGANRDDDPSVGGTTVFRHSIYQQDTSTAVIRRNFFMDPSATGCSCRGDTSIQENVLIDNPLSIIGGLGDGYDVVRPNGVAIDIGFNAILGDADINTNNPRGQAILTGNGKQGSTVHDNLIARSRNPDGVNVWTFSTQANYDQPSYAAYDNNLVYRWSTPTYQSNAGAFPAQDFATYTNNVWDAPAEGSNKNVQGTTFPNPYTSAQLFAALGCTDKATCAAKMIETPEADWAPKARALLWKGYGK